MKRALLILFSLASSACCLAVLHSRARAIRSQAAAMHQQYTTTSNESWTVELRIERVRESLTNRSPVPVIQPTEPARPVLESDLARWLVAGDYQNAPLSLIPKLCAALDLPWAEQGDYILVSKDTLRWLSFSAIKKGGKLSDTLCDVLDISPEQRNEIETALTQSTTRYFKWAKAHVQREAGSGDVLARFTIPASEKLLSGITNQLGSIVQNALGAERTDFFHEYTDPWIQNQAGAFGAVTNILSVSRNTDESGNVTFNYKFERNGSGRYWSSSMSGHINPLQFPAVFRSVFPGGWQQVAAEIGIQLPPKPGSPAGSPQ